jgi:hypothetical protein
MIDAFLRADTVMVDDNLVDSFVRSREDGTRDLRYVCGVTVFVAARLSRKFQVPSAHTISLFMSPCSYWDSCRPR